MDALIDTQAFIWFCENNPRLISSMRMFMERSSNLVVSMASFWEITIKTSLGKLTVYENVADAMDKAIFKGFKILPIERSHLITLSTLDLIHRDPFDRIIIAQAITENLALVSSDDIFQQYPVNRVWQ